MAAKEYSKNLRDGSRQQEIKENFDKTGLGTNGQLYKPVFFIWINRAK